MKNTEFQSYLHTLAKEAKTETIFSELSIIEKKFSIITQDISNLKNKWKIMKFSKNRGLMNEGQMRSALKAAVRDFSNVSFNKIPNNTSINFKTLIDAEKVLLNKKNYVAYN